MQKPRWLLITLAALAFATPVLHAAKAKQLEEIVLKENPTKKDIAAYLEELEKAFSSPQYKLGNATNVVVVYDSVSAAIREKLGQISSAHVPQVIDRAVSLAQTPGKSEFRALLIDSVKDRTDLDDSSKEAIFRGIPDHSLLVGTVIRMGWIKGSEAKLLKLAKGSYENGARRFIELVAKIDTPEARKLLPELMLRGHCMSMAESFKIALGQDLPWLEPEPLVSKAWKKIKAAPGRATWDDPMHFAAIAARFGETDALIMIAKLLNGAANQNTERDASVRQQLKDATFTLQQTIDADVLDTKSLVKFVLDNRDSLVFDKATRKYRVK
jgi:hypothetical protein